MPKDAFWRYNTANPKEYSINYQRMIKFIDGIIKDIAPGFDSKNTFVKEFDFGKKVQNFYSNDTKSIFNGIPYARYEESTKEVEFNRDIFEELEKILGEKLMEYCIDWFNKEFNRNAERLITTL